MTDGPKTMTPERLHEIILDDLYLDPLVKKELTLEIGRCWRLMEETDLLAFVNKMDGLLKAEQQENVRLKAETRKQNAATYNEIVCPLQRGNARLKKENARLERKVGTLKETVDLSCRSLAVEQKENARLKEESERLEGQLSVRPHWEGFGK